MAIIVQVTDIEARWRPLSGQDRTVAQSLLADAWALLTSRRPQLEADIASGSVSTASVVRVVSAMVIRVLRNPDGKLQESVDDYSYRRDSLVSSGVLHVTDSELADLTPAGRARRSSVRLVVYGDG
jgi:hypothetical protein